MKKFPHSLLAATVMFAFGGVALSAQSCAAVDPSRQASIHAAAASGEASAAVGNSAAGSAHVAGAVVAVPLWASGAVVAVSGSAVAAVGDALAHGGNAATEGANGMWDFATGDPAQRPHLDREKSVPPAPPALAPARAKDPSPAEAFKGKI